MTKDKLEVDDKVMVFYYGKHKKTVTVKRVTKTQAQLDDEAFPKIKREVSHNGFLYEVGEFGSWYTYRLWTPELEEDVKKETQRREFLRKYDTIDWNSLPYEAKQLIFVTLLKWKEAEERKQIENFIEDQKKVKGYDEEL